MARSVIKTNRIFRPFPITENSRDFRFTLSLFSATNSDILKPVENNISIIASSREASFSSFFPRKFRNLSNSSSEIPATFRGSSFTSSIFSGESRFSARSLLCANFKNERTGTKYKFCVARAILSPEFRDFNSNILSRKSSIRPKFISSNSIFPTDPANNPKLLL